MENNDRERFIKAHIAQPKSAGLKFVEAFAMCETRTETTKKEEKTAWLTRCPW